MDIWIHSLVNFSRCKIDFQETTETKLYTAILYFDNAASSVAKYDAQGSVRNLLVGSFF